MSLILEYVELSICAALTVYMDRDPPAELRRGEMNNPSTTTCGPQVREGGGGLPSMAPSRSVAARGAQRHVVSARRESGRADTSSPRGASPRRKVVSHPSPLR
eukprot:667950-Prymnesium_polylepis.1